MLNQIAVSRPRQMPAAALSGLAAPAVPQLRNLARVPVGLQVSVDVRWSGGVETKDIHVAATWLDRLGNRLYAGTMNGNAFVVAAWKLEALLGFTNESAPAFASALS